MRQLAFALALTATNFAFLAAARADKPDAARPLPESRGVSLFATGGTARLRALEAWELKP